MKYYLLKDMNNGEPYEMLGFKEDVCISDVQDLIRNSSNYYYDNEDELGSYACAYDYVMHKLYENYKGMVQIEWSNENNLYF